MSKKKKPKHYWNFRVITKLHEVGNYEEFYRTFSICEVHYENKTPISYGEKGMLVDFEYVKDLKWSIKKIKKALKKPVLDADKWPNEWSENK
jgi:hypothetical protein